MDVGQFVEGRLMRLEGDEAALCKDGGKEGGREGGRKVSDGDPVKKPIELGREGGREGLPGRRTKRMATTSRGRKRRAFIIQSGRKI